MGILGELSILAKAGQREQIHSLLEQDQLAALITANNLPGNPRLAGSLRRTNQHNREISLASFL